MILLVILVGVLTTIAQTSLSVPNGSFESPVVGPPLYAGAVIDDWEKTPEPPGYDTNVFGAWDEKSGVFFNVPNPQPIAGVDGLQAAFLFTFPGAGFFQDYESVGGTNEVPSHAFDETFQVGRRYRLTAGFTTSSTFSLAEGATLRFGLYYRDGFSNRIPVASSIISFSTNIFTNIFELTDFSVETPTVQVDDPWAGEHIGVEFVSTTDIALASGIWDIDNIRLEETLTPFLSEAAVVGGGFQFVVNSEAGGVLEVLASTNPIVPLDQWTLLDTVTNVSGVDVFQDPALPVGERYYRVLELP